eukprot:2288479-Rhodomonas_salina.2
MATARSAQSSACQRSTLSVFVCALTCPSADACCFCSQAAEVSIRVSNAPRAVASVSYTVQIHQQTTQLLSASLDATTRVSRARFVVPASNVVGTRYGFLAFGLALPS